MLFRVTKLLKFWLSALLGMKGVSRLLKKLESELDNKTEKKG